MKEQLLKKSLTSGKMKTIVFLAIMVFSLFPYISNATCVSFGVTFGNPQSAGGICTGKGVCKTFAITSDAAQSAVAVTFMTTSSNPNVLIMRFSMSDLLRKQSEQVSYFNDPSGYTFDSPFSLTGPEFAPLSLQSNASVPSGVSFTTSIAGDIVSVYIPYAHDTN